MAASRNHLLLVGIAFTLLASRTDLAAAAPPSTAPAEFFEKRVRPVLAEHCFKCHGADPAKIKGGLRVDSRAALVRGGDSGAVLVPGDPAKSRLIEAISYKNVDLQMPPKGRLPEAVLADVTTWVQTGAVWPEERSSTVTASQGFDLARRKAEHWAWQPVHRPEVPAVKNKPWSAGPVDAFLLARLEEEGLSPAPPADRRTLLRRVYFDLVGLPPSPEVSEQFAHDPDGKAYERMVDKLLASPAYGERWARHWLDLVRYADTRGHEFDSAIANAWQYRDYVIRALNADVPYNQFVREHIAGDLLETPRKNAAEGFNESILGTGFWLLGEEVHSPVDIRQDLADRLDNRIDVMSKTFLGLTVSCARCHDHKFDAISAKDYYALFGILEGAGSRSVRFDSLEQNRRVAAELARWRRTARTALHEALAADSAVALSKMAAYLLAARDVWLGLTPDQRAEIGTTGPDGEAEANDALHRQLTAVAEHCQLDENLLTEWTTAVLAAENDPENPLHAWAQIAAEQAASKPDRFRESLRRTVDEKSQRDAAAAAARAGSEIVLDYAKCIPAEWLPDEGAFGPGPELPGSVCVANGSGPRVRLAQEGAAVYDRVWDAIAAAPGSEKETGALGRRLRAGRTISTPPFTITTGKLYYRVRGTGMAYAAVEGHSLIAGPLHGQLVLDFKGDDGFRWVVHDLTPYRGRRTRVEFTAVEGSNLAIAEIVQAERDPGVPAFQARAITDLLASDRCNSLESLAQGYERVFRYLLLDSDCEHCSAARDEAARARLANWLLSRPGLLIGHAVRDAADKAGSEQSAIAAGLRKDSRLALALLDAGRVDEHVFVRGSPKVLGEKVPRRFLEALAGPAPFPDRPGSGRSELAEQMTDPARNPLLARVMVNRLWHHLFGRGIVASTDNFGVLGERPTHRELLDYLADEFVRRGWSVKAMVRMLVLSNAYRMDAQGDPTSDAADPQNLLLHHMRIRRLEGEAIRDAMLAVSGRLDAKQFGPSVPVNLTPFLDGRGRPASGGSRDGDGRRSIYLAMRRNFLSPFLLAFDTPIPFSTMGRRNVSNVPAQALILLNDPFVHDQADAWARQILDQPGNAAERLNRMYLQAFARPPLAAERETCLAFLKTRAELDGVSEDAPAAWADLAHALFNVKEFVFIR
jgi:Protein of unknown function (DUF1553)/Protein of unknown function (DUF1549)/Planctomycete cytochrome C